MIAAGPLGGDAGLAHREAGREVGVAAGDDDAAVGRVGVHPRALDPEACWSCGRARRRRSGTSSRARCRRSTPPWPLSVEPALTQWPAVSRKPWPVDGLRRLKPAEQELPLMPSPPSMKFAAAPGASSEKLDGDRVAVLGQQLLGGRRLALGGRDVHDVARRVDGPARERRGLRLRRLAVPGTPPPARRGRPGSRSSSRRLCAARRASAPGRLGLLEQALVGDHHDQVAALEVVLGEPA